ncbi:MAG: hypothetical protein E7059_05620 [Treponema bryantii]|nr:hypothetical protein [Treponema bryantii]
MISSLGNMNAFTYSTISSAGTGKLYVPVSQNSLLYSHFSHVSGVAAKNDQSGVSISKIRILNSLIENLTNAKTASVEKEKITHMPDEQVDVLIQKYQKQIQQAATSQYLIPGSQIQAGLIFSFDA